MKSGSSSAAADQMDSCALLFAEVERRRGCCRAFERMSRALLKFEERALLFKSYAASAI